ncbi:MAG: hypothetical protein FWG25_04780, partial [Promicromonosporaceae bacterium]|nr:hypothetical protein [Promicromonosporaceae bacterium]
MVPPLTGGSACRNYLYWWKPPPCAEDGASQLDWLVAANRLTVGARSKPVLTPVETTEPRW